MAEIVPNRVPCGKKPTPTPPQPEPTPVTLCDLTGIKYFKLQSEIPGDYTKNCGLLGNEIDENFYFLRSMDIKTGYTVVEEDRKYLVLERVNCGREIKIDITDEDAYDHGFRVDDGYIFVKYPDGHEDPMRDGDGKPVRFLVEGDNVRVVTDPSIQGDGTYENPLGVDLAYRTGTYAPADFFADLTCPEITINDVASGIGYGHAVVTKENVSRFGALYTFFEAKKLNKDLNERYGEHGWRIPSKEDWAKLLNWAEEKDENRMHDTNRSGNFGCVAGARLKSTILWDGKGNRDDLGFTVYPVGICPEDYNTREPSQYGFTGLYKVSSFWSSTEKDDEAYVRTFSYGHDDVAQYTESPARRLSIRLVRDINENFDINDYEDILGNYVPTVLTTDGKQLWTLYNIDFTNYKDCNKEGITIPEEWKDVDLNVVAHKYYELVESIDISGCPHYEYEEIEEHLIPSTATPKEVIEVPENPDADSDQYLDLVYFIHLDMTTEAKFFYNAKGRDGWHKKLMREGESVVLIYEDFETGCDTAATPYVTSANTNHEWRVYSNEQTGLDELIDVAEAIKGEMSKEFKEIWEHISGLTERVDILSGYVGDMYDEMQSGFSSAFTAISDLQDELDRVESGCGLDNDGYFIVPRESGLTSGSTSLRDAIAILDDVILEDEEVIAAAFNDLNDRMINLSGVVNEMKDEQGGMQEEIDNIEKGVGLKEDGSYSAKTGTNYLDDAESVEGEIGILDEVVKEISDEVEELKNKTIEPLDDSIIVEAEASGYTTYIGVQIDENDKHIVIGDGTDMDGDGEIETGLWFNGEFKLDEEDDEDFYD
jgi:uncharacterized protein (TIGR02145 family)